MAESRRRNGTGPEVWWRREGNARRGFRYIGANGRELTSEATLARIRALVIPPAWTDVHISPDPDRKVQVWGFDAAGRKQYRYSAGHVQRQDRKKWRRVLQVADALPTLRAATNRHLKRPGLDREKVLATVVRLICRAYFRAGSERYAVANRTFGICTLRKKHVDVNGRNLVFTYTGKRSLDQRQVVAATPLVEIIEDLLELPGSRLFQFVADEEAALNGNGRPERKAHSKRSGRKRRMQVKPSAVRSVTAQHVNRYIGDVLGQRFTSKDLRTFGGTVRAATILADLGPARTETEAKRNIALACKLVAAELGNTPTICRKAYIHPAVLEQYAQGRTVETHARRRRGQAVPDEEREGYYPEEVALIRFLERYG
ncbi:MAG: DNA topoisomerase IB [Longimicrobiales bacterium]